MCDVFVYPAWTARLLDTELGKSILEVDNFVSKQQWKLDPAVTLFQSFKSRAAVGGPAALMKVRLTYNHCAPMKYSTTSCIEAARSIVARTIQAS